ncbi:MAG: DNA polymerase IV [Bacteroidales bacterium]|nr:DNA polymerase IV [Bacteroidales bacterium]
MILHLDLDTFFVSVERLLNPELIGKSVICGGLSDRSVVSTASYEVRKFGVHSGMSMPKALKLCPQAIVIQGERKNYCHYSNLVTQIIKDNAPIYQQMSIDEFFIDLAGMERFFDIVKWSHDLRMKIINETSLPISFGLSVNKTVAKIASGKAKPMGELFIPKEKVQDFLDPLPVNKIPGIGDAMMPRLRQLGILTIKDLRLFPKGLFLREFRPSAEALWLKACGIDNSKVVPERDPKSLSTETTFETDVYDPVFLQDTLLFMADNLSYRLRKQGKKCTTVAVKFKYPSFQTQEKQKAISPTDFTGTIADTAIMLFKTMYKGQLLRLIGLRLNISNLETQNDLFSFNPKKDKLERAIDNLKDKFGKEVVMHGNYLS